MSDYYAYTRTNYFRVTDEKRYAELYSRLVGESGGYVQDFSEVKNGIQYHGFGAEDGISAIPMDIDPDVDEDFDYDFDGFLRELQKILPDDEAFIFTEVGHEKLCYLVGYSIVVTNSDIKTVDIERGAIEMACQMLNNDEFRTKMNY